MAIRDMLRKKDATAELMSTSTPPQSPPAAAASDTADSPVPEFTFLRTTTTTQEVMHLPNYEDAPAAKQAEPRRSRLASHFWRKSQQPAAESTAATTTAATTTAAMTAKDGSKTKDGAKDATKQLQSRDGVSDNITEQTETSRSLSERLHLRRHSRGRSRGHESEFVPTDLPSITPATPTDGEAEAKWEKRATLLAGAEALRSRSVSATRPGSSAGPQPVLPQIQNLDNADLAAAQKAGDSTFERPGTSRSISDAKADVSVQEAIRLHDSGSADDLKRSTEMFATLADPDGANNALAQVLYGLALRHGWGIDPQPALALNYLTTAASNSAAVESAALTSGSTTGGAAKGELVLAIYELANSFRQGWGVERDTVAARQYYETAANLGDTDAMVETATCYLEGIGGPKDKWMAAQYLRRAEKGGKKSVGESWIWKEKYNDPPGDGKGSAKKKK